MQEKNGDAGGKRKIHEFFCNIETPVYSLQQSQTSGNLSEACSREHEIHCDISGLKSIFQLHEHEKYFAISIIFIELFFACTSRSSNCLKDNVLSSL